MTLKNKIFRLWNRLKLWRRNRAASFISKRNVPAQILGASLSTWCSLVLVLGVIILIITYHLFPSPETAAQVASLQPLPQILPNLSPPPPMPMVMSEVQPQAQEISTLTKVLEMIWKLSIPTLIFFEVVFIVRKLSPIFSLRRQELSITWSQICILIAFLGWLISVLIITGLDQKKDLLTIAVAGCILGWVFQDTVKNVVAFLYLRFNDLIHIGDWIIVESRHIDGMVKFVNLTTVTIENWDTTTSSFPIFILYSEPFKNLQSMLDRKTHGRRMFMSFVLDSGWVQPLTLPEAENIVKKIETDQHFKDTQILEVVREAFHNDKEVLNLSLFRHYVHHWLMNNKKFSRAPRLIVRYLEPTEFGIPMQIYGYIVDVSLESFEWVQSETIEHLLQVMTYFNLRLYQSPSGFDASNSNIYLAPESTPYKNFQ